MDPQERAFLDAVEKGDLPSVARWLSSTPDRCPVSVNCTDMLGRSAIQIAVDNENIELVELLLKQEGVRIERQPTSMEDPPMDSLRDYCRRRVVIL
ncbi:transient-receptor-potential-like protein [Elysia marginata]|uniref:Transient-receptor-potential-like protein n=1 Tax=Elysia marginata TaxID=1093978 RepID=A0AAV4J0E9_9GAST|nr:transient-receptor-potential-like protein [Elysia marginata]